MHQAIFSDKERGMIKEYLESGKQGEGFRVLKHRIKQYEMTFIEDFDLLLKFLSSIKETKLRLNDNPEESVVK